MKLKLKTKRWILGLVAACMSGLALAQTTIYPQLHGTYSEHRQDIGYFGMLRLQSADLLTATASGTLSSSQVLTSGINRFTTVASSGDAATLPTLYGAVVIVVINGQATNPMNIFPNSSTSTINALTAGTAFSLAAGKTAIFFQGSCPAASAGGDPPPTSCVGTIGQWYAILSA